jgi:hypothetical protein
MAEAAARLVRADHRLPVVGDPHPSGGAAETAGRDDRRAGTADRGERGRPEPAGGGLQAGAQRHQVPRARVHAFRRRRVPPAALHQSRHYAVITSIIILLRLQE